MPINIIATLSICFMCTVIVIDQKLDKIALDVGILSAMICNMLLGVSSMMYKCRLYTLVEGPRGMTRARVYIITHYSCALRSEIVFCAQIKGSR